jgi:hypothetical protein
VFTKAYHGLYSEPDESTQHRNTQYFLYYIVTDLINALPGNISVNTIQQATIEEAVFSVDPTDTPIGWMDSDHVICVYCRSMSVPRLYKSVRIRSRQLGAEVAAEARQQGSKQ